MQQVQIASFKIPKMRTSNNPQAKKKEHKMQLRINRDFLFGKLFEHAKFLYR